MGLPLSYTIGRPFVLELLAQLGGGESAIEEIELGETDLRKKCIH